MYVLHETSLGNQIELLLLKCPTALEQCDGWMKESKGIKRNGSRSVKLHTDNLFTFVVGLQAKLLHIETNAPLCCTHDRKWGWKMKKRNCRHQDK